METRLTSLEKLKLAKIKRIKNYTKCACGSEYRYQGYCPYCQGSGEQIIKAKKSHAMKYRKQGEGIHLGVELEVDGFKSAELLYETAWKVFTTINQPNESQRIEIEYDPTISKGMEIITQPLTLREHQSKIDWSYIFTLVQENGMMFSESCDLHVHVDKYSEEFAKRLWEAVNHEYRHEFEVYAKEKEIRNKYSEFEGGRYEQRKDSRRVACNVKNKHTVEIRIFRQPKNQEEMMKMLELVNRMVEQCLKKGK